MIPKTTLWHGHRYRYLSRHSTSQDAQAAEIFNDGFGTKAITKVYNVKGKHVWVVYTRKVKLD